MLKLCVHVMKKTGLPNYGSCGAAVDLEVEADTELLARSDGLQLRLRDLFAEATVAVEAQLRLSTATDAAARTAPERERRNLRRATSRQLQALAALTMQRELDPAELAAEQGVVDLAELSVTQASRMIERLQRLSVRTATEEYADAAAI